MRAIVLSVVALVVTTAAGAQERAKLAPVTLQGNWFASPAGPPANCNGDGTFIAFAPGTKKVSVSITQRTGTSYSQSAVTTYTIAAPPKDAPANIGLFLDGEKSHVGIAMQNNMQIQWIPSGADGAYATVGMHLRRC